MCGRVCRPSAVPGTGRDAGQDDELLEAGTDLRIGIVYRDSLKRRGHRPDRHPRALIGTSDAKAIGAGDSSGIDWIKLIVQVDPAAIGVSTRDSEIPPQPLRADQ